MDLVASSTMPGGYLPGVCNIGPAEIARRRRAGQVGAVMTAGLLGSLLAVHAPRWTRLSIVVPAMVSASGYLQARLRFCAAFGALGIYNLGAIDQRTQVADPKARARDRVRANQIALGSLAIGLVAAAAAVALPR